MEKVTVILPAYNEEITIRESIAAFHEALPEAEIIIVDNCSTDGTKEIAQSTLRDLNVPGRVLSERRKGKGNAVRRAFREIDADVYLLVDADLTYPPDQANELIQPILDNEADMVVGDRLTAGHYFRENKRPFHDWGNRLLRNLVNSLFRAKLADIMSGYRAFSRTFVKTYPILVEGFELETDMTLHALDKRFRIHEIPIAYKDRPPGSFSKLSTFADGARVLFTFAQILRYYRPLQFFGGVALLFFLAGLAAGLPVLLDWVHYRYVYHVPLAILAASLEILAVLAFNTGLVLDSITHLNRMHYERDLL